MQESRFWFRVLQVTAFVAVAVAAFEAGVLWQQNRTKRPATAKPAPTTRPNPQVPAPQGVGVRAEFNPQSALLIGANELVRYQQDVFTNLVRAIHTRVPIIGIVNDDDDVQLGRDLLQAASLPYSAVTFIKHPLDSMWLRDYGPMFARWSGGHIQIVDPTYTEVDADQERARDDAFPAFLGRILNLDVNRLPLAIEGGNLLSNGDGLMVTTTRVIESPANRQHSVKEIGQLLQEHFGCRVWVYLRTLEGEPTGHADLFVTFLRRNLVLVAQLDAADDPVNAAILDEAAATLGAQKSTMGPIHVERIPMPPRTKSGAWRSYNNVLLINGVVLMPTYTDVDPALEQRARDAYQKLLPHWEIATINADQLVEKRGVLHCIGIGIPGYVNVAPLLGEAAD